MVWALFLIVTFCALIIWKVTREDTKYVSIKTVAKNVADVNNDGKINVKDVVATAENVKKEVTRAKRKYGGKVAAKTKKEKK